MDVDSVLSKATIIVKHGVDPTSEKVDDDRPMPDELVTSFFQIRDADLSKNDTEALNKISEYVKEMAKSEDPIDRLNVLREIKFKLGDPELGVKKFQQVYQYIKLKQAAKKYTTEAMAMEEK